MNKEYRQKYYLENKEACLDSMKKWAAENSVHLKEYRRQDYLKNKETRLAKQTAYRIAHAEEISQKQKSHRSAMRRLIDSIAIAYGCQNPECQWVGSFLPCQLEFHHFNPVDKKFQIGKAADFSKKAVAIEVNKCVVLCGCCHALFHVGGVLLNESMLCKVDENLIIEIT